MDSAKRTTHSRDILASPWLVFAFFGLPVIAMATTGRANLSDGFRTLVWAVALSIMGTACVVNAIRCGRLHCYVTGPFLLAMAVVAGLYGLGLVPLGRNGWNLIGLAILARAIVLCCLPELFLGKYRKSTARDGDPRDGDHC